MAAYIFVTANDNWKRDPVSWTFHAILPDESDLLIDAQTNLDPPYRRYTPYPPFYLIHPQQQQILDPRAEQSTRTHYV